MQAQLTRTEVQAITHSQSLTAIQTLLRAGLGCITFLRDLLPADNFHESHFTTSEDSLTSQSTDACAEKRQKRTVNGFKIMAITQGYSDEADKLTNFLERGIFDALEKQYLRSFIFAIYLDNKDPNNIIEAYTFNFHYHTVPGTDIIIPVMSLGEDLTKMSLKDRRSLQVDPIEQAAKMGRAPTYKDVKRSVKALLKTLIHCMTQMDVLPKRRYATFKIFYTPDTPPDYEPPHFQAGDAEKDKWFFMTHDLDEIPDQWSVGKVDTGHHAVNINVTSVATYLPSSTVNNDATFTGTTTHLAAPPTLTPIQEAVLRMQQTEAQLKDAAERNVVWAAEDAINLEVASQDADAEGVDDPDYVKRPDGGYDLAPFHHVMVPVGLRNEAGDIQPMDIDEAHFGGVSENVPTRLTEMNATKKADIPNLDQTQRLDDLAHIPRAISPTRDRQVSSSSTFVGENIVGADDDVSRSDSRLPPSDMGSSFSSIQPGQSSDIDTQMLMDIVPNNAMSVDILDVETQAMPITEARSVESIDSFGPNLVDDIVEDILSPRMTAQEEQSGDDFADPGRLECECGVFVEDACCFCEGGCGRWYHVWCMGYHSVKDNRMPAKFLCFDCRVRGDISWEFIKVDLYPKMLSKFRELALFRRAIKIAETKALGTPAEFAKSIGCDNVLARQLFKRLEIEGFIAEQPTVDDPVIVETRSRSVRARGRTKTKQTKPRKNLQKPKYIFNRVMKSGAEYSDYFNPDQKVEGRMLGLPQLKANIKSQSKPPQSDSQNAELPMPSTSNSLPLNENESQTQEETQILLPPAVSSADLKRPMTIPDRDAGRVQKKIKVSVTRAVDLAE